MSKANRETQLSRGEQLLREWGTEADAGVEALTALRGRDPAADIAIAARLGAIADAASVEALLEIERRSTDKLLHKEVKRALYRLEQKGLVIPQAAAEPPTPLVIGPAIEGYLSAFDGRGDQLVWLVKARPGGVDHLFAVLNDPEGLKEIGLAESTRKLLRASSDELRAKHDIRMVSADWRYCDFLIGRAYGWASRRKQTVSGDYRGLRAHLLTEPAPESLPPLVFRLFDPAAVRADTAALNASPGLLDEKEFRTWFFMPEDLKPYLDELHKVKESPLVLSEIQQRDRFAEIMTRAVEEIFGGEHQASWVRRFEDMAYYFHATNRRDRATQALATALALEASQHGGRDVPFCEVLTRTCFAAYWQMEERQEAEEARGSLVVTPAQIARESQRRKR